MPSRARREAAAKKTEAAAVTESALGHLVVPEGADVRVSPPSPGVRRCWARWPMEYGTPSRDVDRGQEVMLAGERNDEKLLRLGYVVEAQSSERGVVCGPCGAKFRTDADRDYHGRKRHRDRFAALDEAERAAAEDQAEDRELRETARQNPLHLDRTAAALG